MKTYDGTWVETQVDQTVKVWHDSAGVSAPPARRYSLEEQRVNEDAYDQALLEVEDADQTILLGNGEIVTGSGGVTAAVIAKCIN
jgi:hypothetical protein